MTMTRDDLLDAVDHVVEDRALHQHARAGDACLAGVEVEHRRDGEADRRRIEVGIREHDVRRLTTEFEDSSA